MGSQVSKPQSAFSLQVSHRLQQNLELFLDTEKKERNKEEERKTEDEFSLQRIGGRGRSKREGGRDGAERDWCRSSPEAVCSNLCRRGNHPMAPASQVSSTKTRRHAAKTYWHFRKRESPAVLRLRGDLNPVTKTSPM